VTERVERRLTAILAADVARLMGAEEEGTLKQLKANRWTLVDPKITEHRGRIVKTTGDGILVEFASVVDALRCAVEVQRGMAERNAEVPQDKRIELRIGIHQGDVIIEGGDIFGDGVNVAARLESIADPGGICVSARVQEDARGKIEITFEDMGEQQLKNIERPVRVYRVRLGGAAASPRRRQKRVQRKGCDNYPADHVRQPELAECSANSRKHQLDSERQVRA
jgi:adenylate cyclase